MTVYNVMHRVVQVVSADSPEEADRIARGLLDPAICKFGDILYEYGEIPDDVIEVD